MTSPRGLVLGRSAGLPVLWIFLALISAPLVGMVTKGSFTAPGNWPLYVSLTGAVIGTVGIFVKPKPHGPYLRETLLVAGALLLSTSVIHYSSPLLEPGLFFYGIALCAILISSGRGWIGTSLALLLLAGRLFAVIILQVDPPPGPMEFIDLYSVAVVGLALAWLRFARKLVRNENSFRERGRVAVEKERAREKAFARHRMGNALATSGAQRALQMILIADSITPDLHAEIRLAESALRDHIRCPGLMHPLLTPEIQMARKRGVEVLLLGTFAPSDAPAPLTDRLAGYLAAQIHQASEGSTVTLRQLAPHDQEIAVTLLISSADGDAHLQQLTDQGELATVP